MRKSIAKDILPDDASGGGKSMEIVFPLFTKQTSVCADWYNGRKNHQCMVRNYTAQRYYSSNQFTVFVLNFMNCTMYSAMFYLQ